MSDLEKVRQWVEAACSHPPGSVQRQRYLTQVIRLTADKLWRESTPYYADALQQTWVYFCQNVCEGKTGQPYNPDLSTVPTWLNAYLKRRLQDGFIDQRQEAATRSSGQRRSRSGEVEGDLDPVENLAAEPDAPPILAAVQQWVDDDRSGELRQVCVSGHPQVTAQWLLQRRLPPETSWKVLASETGLSISTLSSFYQRQCLPRLRKFGESEGYL